MVTPPPLNVGRSLDVPALVRWLGFTISAPSSIHAFAFGEFPRTVMWLDWSLIERDAGRGGDHAHGIEEDGRVAQALLDRDGAHAQRRRCLARGCGDRVRRKGERGRRHFHAYHFLLAGPQPELGDHHFLVADMLHLDGIVAHWQPLEHEAAGAIGGGADEGIARRQDDRGR